jgi:beta-lactamase regulating signal transducer with metallopeptidase domain
MTFLTNWIFPSAMHSLGWTLLHFLWQGTAIAALAAVLMTLCRHASARYILAVGALALMLAAPVATFLFLTSFEVAPRHSSRLAEERSVSTSNVAVESSAGVSRLFPSFDALPWLVEAWLLGVAFFSLRSAGGFLLLERERRKQSAAVSARVLAICQALQRELGMDRAIRYCECRWLQAPAVIGWFSPMVLLPATALTGLSEEQLQSIIVHELAHIRRLDPFVNVFQISVETLLFYHPAVWWLNKRIRAEREHCCDDVAVSLCGNPVEYARALTLMEEWRRAPALAMAANRGPLSLRIFRVLGLNSIGAGRRGIGLTGGLLCLTAALVAGNALLGIAYPRPIVHADGISQARVSLARFAWPAVPSPQSSSTPAATAAAAVKPSAARPAAAAQPPAGGSYIDGMNAAGLNNLTVDQLIALKIQNVTPEYVRGLVAQGVHPDVEHVIAMRIQGVTPEYVHDLRELGVNPEENKLIALKIQGVTPDYVRALRDQGLQPDPQELVGMRIQDVTVDYVRDIHALGLAPSVHQFVAMRIQDVTAEYVKGLQAAGFKFDVDDIIRAKIQDISPEFIERAVKHGFQNLTLDKLVQLKHMGVLESPADL